MGGARLRFPSEVSMYSLMRLTSLILLVAGLIALGHVQAQPAGALQVSDDPGNLQAYRGRDNETFYFRVTGRTSGAVWGTDVYTDDSMLAVAAVHAGVLQADETGVVAVTILPGQSSYRASIQNGVTTSQWGQWDGSFSVASAQHRVQVQPLDVASAPTVVAGVPTTLTYTVVAQNLSGVPVIDPIIRDNGTVLNNDEAVKTGGNDDNILEVGETWTWTYEVTVTGVLGEDIVNTATIEGPSDGVNQDINPDNNTASTVVTVVPPPGSYDLAISKTVSVADASAPPVSEEETETRPETAINTDQCGEWIRAGSGGYKGTRDPYDLSELPVGTTFDLRWDTIGVPDRYVVKYPAQPLPGVTVFDTGWRGNLNHLDNKPDVAHLYPGGVIGPPRGEAESIFTKGLSNQMTVIVYGPESGTRWHYQIRANCPTP